MKSFKKSVYNIVLQNGKNTFLYNTVSGSLVKLDSETLSVYDNIENESFDAFDNNHNIMLRKGFIVERHIDESGFLFQRTYSAIYSHEPEAVSYTVVLTNRCNYNCYYCFENNDGKKMQHVDSDALIKFIESQVLGNRRLKNLRITWFGGEPLLCKDSIIKISAALIPFLDERKIKYSSSIITNGYDLTDDIISKLNELRVSHVQVTLDGMHEFYSKYKRTMESSLDRVLLNVRSLIDSKSFCSIGLRLNCNKGNLESVFSLLEYLDETGYLPECEIGLSPILSSGKDDLNDEEFSDVLLRFYTFLYEKGYMELVKKQLKRPRIMSCGYVGYGSYIIDTDGTLKKCERHIGLSKMVIGDLINGKYYNSVERDFQNGEMEGSCADCNIYPICRGGCKERKLKGEKLNCAVQRRSIMDLLNLLIQ